jgi:2'-5' RNA ligase
MKRLFIAIKIKPDQHFLDVYQTLRNDLSHEKIKWVPEENLHLTLRFLGETNENKIDRITKAITEASIKRQFEFSVKDTGIFGSSYRPKVIWFGITPKEDLQKLAGLINQSLSRIGYTNDRQNFVPHLTAGRIKELSDKTLFQNIISKYKTQFLQKVNVNEIILFESVLLKQGATYRTLETFKL